MVHFANSRFFSFRKIQIFFHFAKSIFFSFHKIQIHRLATSFSDSENSPLECKLFLLSERLITSYVYLCLIFTIGSFRKIQIFFHFAKSSCFFSFHKIQIYRLATSFSDSENSPLECTLFLLSQRSITLYVYLCLIFTIGSFHKIQIFFTDLQQTVCGCNWFISQNPDIFFHFAKSRFYKCCRKC